MSVRALIGSTGSAGVALPWCCILPGVFSFAGLSVAGAGWLVGPQHLWIFLMISSSMLAYSLYGVLVRREGAPLVRAAAISIVLITIAIWLWRFH